VGHRRKMYQVPLKYIEAKQRLALKVIYFSKNPPNNTDMLLKSTIRPIYHLSLYKRMKEN
jgi:hypothetical protein